MFAAIAKTAAPINTIIDYTYQHIDPRFSASRGATRAQWIALVSAIGLSAALAIYSLDAAGWTFRGLLYLGMGAAIGLRCAALHAVRRQPQSTPLQPVLQSWPTYSVIVPLYHEANMAAQAVAAMARLDYPTARLEILFVVEADDAETRGAFQRIELAPHMRLLTVPDGTPKTKPRASNFGLAQARGELLVIYDAEDQPSPPQLKEAAARFASADARLACLQAPLRILPRDDFIGRMFAAEYAALFELILPFLAHRAGVFPLGGTSNHFRRGALQAVGGWDAFNVTEDADLGFRLAASGYRCGVLATPTFEPAPMRWTDWLRQRARWIKGYMQTFGVHTRRPFAAGPMAFLVLLATLGLSIASALLHGAFAAKLVIDLALTVALGQASSGYCLDLGFGFASYLVSLISLRQGLLRSGGAFSLRDGLEAPVYWIMQSLAAARALHQLIFEPYRWDKTPHQPEQHEPPALPAARWTPEPASAGMDLGRSAAYVGACEPAPPPNRRYARRPAHPGLERLRARG